MSSLCFNQEHLAEHLVEHRVSPVYPAVASPSSPRHSASSIPMDIEGKKQAHYGIWKESTKGGRSPVTIDMLPDVALLGIFDFCVNISHVEDSNASIEAWHTLVHVCQEWRNVVFGSPRRLNLRLLCGNNKPVREMLGIWPPLPIVISDHGYKLQSIDNIPAALEHNDRICQLDLFNPSFLRLEKVFQAMERPFPALTCLQIRATRPRGHGATIPDSFLGGSVPLLETLYLSDIPFPGLPKLLLTAAHLVHLRLWNIPPSAFFPPEAMVTCLAVLTRLETLHIVFRFHRPLLDQKSGYRPLKTRTLLPVLTNLCFLGVGEYLEVLVAQIDAPLLDNLTVALYPPLIFIFDTPQLAGFIGRAPKLKPQVEALVVISDWEVTVRLSQIIDRTLEFRILCRQLDFQLSALVHVCWQSFPQALIPTVERLYILSGFSPPERQDNVENSLWLDLFHRFPSVKDLYISSEFFPCIAPALQELVGERVTEVLPALKTLFLEEIPQSGPMQEAIWQFVDARQLASHPIAVSPWKRERF